MENQEFISEDVQSIMNKTPSWTLRWGNTITVLVIVLLLNFTWLVKYPDVVEGEVTLTTTIPPEKHFSRVFGKIDTLLIPNYGPVNDGDIIAIIQNTADYKDVLLLYSILDTVDLGSEDFSSMFNSLSNLNLGNLETAYADFENSYLEYQINSIYSPVNTKTKARKNSILDIENRLSSLRLQRSKQQKETEFFKKNLERYNQLHKKGVVSLSEYESKQIEYLDSERRLADIASEIHNVRESRNSAMVSFTDSDFLLKKQSTYLRNTLIQNYNKLKAAIRDWENKFVIKASINGTVNLNKFWSSKTTVNQGDLVCAILPNNTDYILKIKTFQKGLGKVKRGHKVNVDLDNFPAYENGYLQGSVSNIPVLPEEDGSYLIDAILVEGLVTSYKKEVVFSQEMKGMAEVITDKTSLAERLFFSIMSLNKY
ncbi:HlyD family efflux transporter periplasmic adaptor subunit [Flagellimonas onchidii]|uniref:HlyD family efflux transporter periplasmic adaptor subunit n=1 Tax=Flagellimonas onchidii TaxID=2562684 RepID=UPI0010A5E8AC|nr:HlyD family efflux transporter periplasmic adaptor subunit [Allomuricauda onchidii]